MENFIEALHVDKLPPGHRTRVAVARTDVALFNVEGTIYAISDTCPHAGSSLGAGKLLGTIVTCRSHGMKIDVTTGYFAGSSGYAVTSYPVRVVDGKIYVAVESVE